MIKEAMGLQVNFLAASHMMDMWLVNEIIGLQKLLFKQQSMLLNNAVKCYNYVALTIQNLLKNINHLQQSLIQGHLFTTLRQIFNFYPHSNQLHMSM
jgi:hypothetical protein